MRATGIADQNLNALQQAAIQKCGDVLCKCRFIEEITNTDDIDGRRLAFRQIGEDRFDDHVVQRCIEADSSNGIGVDIRGEHFRCAGFRSCDGDNSGTGTEVEHATTDNYLRSVKKIAGQHQSSTPIMCPIGGAELRIPLGKTSQPTMRACFMQTNLRNAWNGQYRKIGGNELPQPVEVWSAVRAMIQCFLPFASCWSHHQHAVHAVTWDELKTIRLKLSDSRIHNSIIISNNYLLSPSRASFLAEPTAFKGVANSAELGYSFWHDENSCSDALLTASDALNRFLSFKVPSEISSMSNADKPVAQRKPRARRRKAVPAGDTPLDYMLKVMRDDEADQKRRDEMAKIAASYVHQKPSERPGAGAKGGRGLTIDLTNATDEQLATLESLFGPLAGSGDDDGGNPRGKGEADG